VRAYPTLLGSLTFHGGMGGCRLFFFFLLLLLSLFFIYFCSFFSFFFFFFLLFNFSWEVVRLFFSFIFFCFPFFFLRVRCVSGWKAATHTNVKVHAHVASTTSYIEILTGSQGGSFACRLRLECLPPQ